MEILHLYGVSWNFFYHDEINDISQIHPQEIQVLYKLINTVVCNMCVCVRSYNGFFGHFSRSMNLEKLLVLYMGRRIILYFQKH